MNLNIYLLKYISISNILINKDILSILDHINYFLDELFKKLHEHTLEFCIKKDWRLNSYNINKNNFIFNELKDFIMIKIEII